MSSDKTHGFLLDVADYYSAKLAQYGETPHGVDWNGGESQVLRFQQLVKVIGQQNAFSINDLGCGYGALFDHLASSYQQFNYNGYDISADMIRAASERYIGVQNACFVTACEPPDTADYSVASGIFNVRLGVSNALWHDYIQATLDVLHRTSRRGFAFNCLTSYSDADKMRDYLYYADPCALFDLCKRRYSSHVALLHDYGLYEFTMLVKKHR
jgi:SAM-dependent methyltransferase